jgi:hypothetical protein
MVATAKQWQLEGFHNQKGKYPKTEEKYANM